MRDNFDLYFEVKKAFENKILNPIDFRDCLNEWNDFYHKTPGTFAYYEMIIHCECFDGGLIDRSVYQCLHKVLVDCFYLKDDQFLEELNQHREDKKYQDMLKASLDQIMEAGEVAKKAFD